MAYNPEGHTPAGWTTVVLIFAGFIVAGIAVINLNWPLFWAGGVGLIVLAGIVGKVMQMMGLGQYPRPVAESADAISDEASAATGDSSGG